MPNKARVLLSGLLLADGLFFVLYFSGQFFDLALGREFVLSSDWSYPEMFQYVKEFIIMGLLFLAFIHFRKKLYLAWTVLFGYFLLDDAVMVREWLGNVIASRLTLSLPLHLRGNDVGEMIALALVGVVLIPLLYFTHASSSQTERRLSRLLLPWLATLVVCGFVFDMVHSAVMNQHGLELLFGFLEDGGEMIVMSLILWVVYRWFTALPQVSKHLTASSLNVASTQS
jgi:hypothetical protein